MTRSHFDTSTFFRLRTALPAFLAAVMLLQASAIAQHGVSQAQFDSFIFQQHGNVELTRERLKSSIELQIRRIEQSIPLSDDQKQSLRLAGEGDIQRFFNRVVAARQKFQALDPEKADFNQAYQIAAPLQTELASGLFGGASLFAKVVRTTLDDRQLRSHQEQEAIRTRQANEAYSRMFLSTLDASLPITTEQREALVELASARLGNMHAKGPFQSQLITYRLFTIPEEKITEILDPGQIVAYRKLKEQAMQAEPFLRQQGVLDDEVE